MRGVEGGGGGGQWRPRIFFHEVREEKIENQEYETKENHPPSLPSHRKASTLTFV